MKEGSCLHCGKSSYGSERRRYCSASCRVTHWQKLHPEKVGKKKPKRKTYNPAPPDNPVITRIVLKEIETIGTEQLQLRFLLDMKDLEGRAEEGDWLALETLSEGYRVMKNIAGKFSH